MLLALNRQISTGDYIITRFTLPRFMRQHEMIVYVQSGTEFDSKEKDGGENLHLGQFNMILVRFHFFLILGLYCSRYVIYNIKVLVNFLKN